MKKVSIHTASRVTIDYRVIGSGFRVRVRDRVSRVRVRVSYPGQPCVSTSFGYTHGYGQS